MLENVTAETLDDFDCAARAFARTLRAGDSVAFSGDLGAGKTTFVRAVVSELLGRDEATSPTFTFRQRYDGTPTIEHLDLYRIEDPREAVELGLDDAFAPDVVTLVEWPERLPALLPPTTIRVAIDGSGDGPRRLAIERPVE